MTEPSKQSGSDPVGDLQRWLVRSGARSVTRQLSGQIRTALGGGKQSNANVWETATTEHDESPECPWCPHCRARRLARESGPGLGAGVAAAADAVGVMMRDAMSAFEAAVAAAGQQTKPRDTTAEPSGEVWDEATDEPAVRTRPPANGDGGRPSGSRPHSVAPQQASTGGKQPSAGAKQPSAGAKQPSAGAKQPTGEAKRATGEAKRPSAGAKKPAAEPRKPAGRSGGSAAADRTSPDEPNPAKPDEPAD